MQYSLPRDAFEILVETFKNKEKAERFARAIEEIVNFTRDKSQEEIVQKKEHIKIELKEELKSIKAVEVPQNPEKTNKIEETKEEKEAKIVEEAIEKDDGTIYDDLDFKNLVKTVTKEFGETSEPICNAVKGWQKECAFYINSYKQLTIVTPLGKVAQLNDPITVNQFWKYIDKNRHQIGKMIDFTANPGQNATFSDLFTDDSGAELYRLWVGSSEAGRQGTGSGLTSGYFSIY